MNAPTDYVMPSNETLRRIDATFLANGIHPVTGATFRYTVGITDATMHQSAMSGKHFKDKWFKPGYNPNDPR